MKEISIQEIQKLSLETLGLRRMEVDLNSSEAIAAQLRRAAGFFCPCSPSTLLQAVSDVSKHFVKDMDSFRQRVKDVLSNMVAYGDFIEGDDWRTEYKVSILYRAPPGFVSRKSGLVLLFGITPDYISVLPTALEQRIEYDTYVRRLRAREDEDILKYLSELGLIQLPVDTWLKSPSEMNAQEHVTGFDQRLDRAGEPGDLSGLSILDPNASVDYYRGRWRVPRNESGRFVSRRPRPYGADLWCYIELREGEPTRLLDLPIDPTRNRGCGEAWRLQAAIDSIKNQPQYIAVTQLPDNKSRLSFFSPIPMWAKRRFDIIGKPIPRSGGCLFSYLIHQDEVSQELDFLRRFLWMNAKVNDKE